MAITLNLRQAIVDRVRGKSEEDLTDVINDSIDNDERTLPGLGVLFELIWQGIDPSTQQQLVAALRNKLDQK